MMEELENKQTVVSEGPIMISTTEVKGEFVMSQLRDKIADAILNGHLVNEENTRVLILSGSHGDGESGDSGLNNIEKLKDVDDKNAGDITSKFYEGDCRRAGLRPLKPKLDIQKLPLPEENIPDITEKKKLNPTFFKNSYLSDNDICNITFQVVNIAYYHKNESRLVQDIKRFDPKVLALAWCFSINGDVSMALRHEGIFAKMVMEHDLREITKNANARLDETQAEIIEKIVEFNHDSTKESIVDGNAKKAENTENEEMYLPQYHNCNPKIPLPPPLPPQDFLPRIKNQATSKGANIFLWGYNGTGKTILLCEALKIKLNKLRKIRSEHGDIKVAAFVAVFQQSEYESTLEKAMKEKYFSNMVSDDFVKFTNLKTLKHEIATKLEHMKLNFHQFRMDVSDEKEVLESKKVKESSENSESQKPMHPAALEGYVAIKRGKKIQENFKSGLNYGAYDENFHSFEKYCKSDINGIIRGLSKIYSKSLLLIDEVPTSLIQNWTNLITVENVEWMIALSPGGNMGSGSAGGEQFRILPPKQPNILSLQLKTRYRNCVEIRQLHSWFVEHYKWGYLDLQDEIILDGNEQLLPVGQVPIWIERAPNISDIDVLQQIENEYVQGRSVTLIFNWQIMQSKIRYYKERPSDREAIVIKWCKDHTNWKYVINTNVQGMEDECVVIITRPLFNILSLELECLTRARSLLVIVTTYGEEKIIPPPL